MEEEPAGPRWQWGPVLVLLVLAAGLLAGWLAFPHFLAFMQRQDCIAAGHMNCDR